jgi:hypothetical protein
MVFKSSNELAPSYVAEKFVTVSQILSQTLRYGKMIWNWYRFAQFIKIVIFARNFGLRSIWIMNIMNIKTANCSLYFGYVWTLILTVIVLLSKRSKPEIVHYDGSMQTFQAFLSARNLYQYLVDWACFGHQRVTVFFENTTFHWTITIVMVYNLMSIITILSSSYLFYLPATLPQIRGLQNQLNVSVWTLVV